MCLDPFVNRLSLTYRYQHRGFPYSEGAPAFVLGGGYRLQTETESPVLALWTAQAEANFHRKGIHALHELHGELVNPTLLDGHRQTRSDGEPQVYLLS